MTAKVLAAWLSLANNLNDILSAKQITLSVCRPPSRSLSASLPLSLSVAFPFHFHFPRELSSPIMRIINLTGSLVRVDLISLRCPVSSGLCVFFCCFHSHVFRCCCCCWPLAVTTCRFTSCQNLSFNRQ